jgi:hypothetical protein
VNLQFLDFVDGSTTYAEWTAVMPDSYDGGTIAAKFVWSCGTGSTNSVVWGIQARAFGDTDDIDQAFGTGVTITAAGNAAANKILITSETSAITIGGTPSGGKMVQFRAYRDGANGSDTLTATARLLAIRIEYTQNGYTD